MLIGFGFLSTYQKQVMLYMVLKQFNELSLVSIGLVFWKLLTILDLEPPKMTTSSLLDL